MGGFVRRALDERRSIAGWIAHRETVAGMCFTNYGFGCELKLSGGNTRKHKPRSACKNSTRGERRSGEQHAPPRRSGGCERISASSHPGARACRSGYPVGLEGGKKRRQAYEDARRRESRQTSIRDGARFATHSTPKHAPSPRLFFSFCDGDDEI